MIKTFSKIITISLCIYMGTLYGQNENGQMDVVSRPINLSGPRIGLTLLSSSVVDKMEDTYNISLKPVISQFGWQFETRFFSLQSGATAVTEWVLLAGGFEQEKFIPSLSWLIGFRSSDGFEFGMGPNLALSGPSIVIATGVTIQSDEINFPINFAISVSKSGPRYSLLVGFNMRKS